jgi:imidazolonepropionase-like amidohydrolase
VRLFRTVAQVRRYIDSGITSIRDVGSIAGPYLKHVIEEGTLVGPRIMSAGPIITQTGGHGDKHYLPLKWMKESRRNLVVDGVEECRKAVRSAFREGVDLIKIMTSGGISSMRDPPEMVQFCPEEVTAMVYEAHNAGLKVATHNYNDEGARMFIEAGGDTIEHGSLLTDDLHKVMIKKNVPMIPTLSGIYELATKGDQYGGTEWQMRKSNAMCEVMFDNVGLAHKAGVKVAVGSDYAAPLRETALPTWEFKLLVEKSGFTPMDSIVAGTKVGAEVLGMEDKLGTIEDGNLADMILVKGNPLEDIDLIIHPENIVLVLKGGEILKKTA